MPLLLFSLDPVGQGFFEKGEKSLHLFFVKVVDHEKIVLPRLIAIGKLLHLFVDFRVPEVFLDDFPQLLVVVTASKLLRLSYSCFPYFLLVTFFFFLPTRFL